MLWRGKPVKVPGYAALARSHDYGRAWYDESGSSIVEYAKRRGFDPQRVCDVVAILSPRVTVSQNVKLARLYLETGRAPGAMKQRLHALARYEASGIFNGPKVNAFSAALAGDPNAVVIDAWMVRLFLDDPKQALTPKTYRAVADKVRGVASRLGWSPAETQASLWCGARSLCGFADSYSPLSMEVAP